MTVAATAATPSLPTIGSFCTPSSSTGILRFFGSCGAVPLGQFRHLTRSQRADGAELRVQLAPGDDEFADPVGGGPVERVAAAVDELAVGLAERLGLVDQVVQRG